MLTPGQIEQYRRDGYLFPFPALSAAELEECNDGLARFERWLGKPVNEGDFRWRSASHVILPWVDALARHPRILDVVEDLIGPDILVYTATWFIKEAKSPTFAAWHQDATYFETDPITVTGFWFALERADRRNGCLWVEPGGHRSPLRERFVVEGGVGRMERRDETPWPSEGSALPLEVDAGALVVFNGLLPHYSAPNRSAKSRHAYSLHAIDAGSHYFADNWLRREALPLRGFL